MSKRQKKKQLKMRNKKFLQRYPFMTPYSAWTGKVRDDYDYTYTEYECVDKGWRIGFGKILLEELREACLKTNYLDKLYFVQIKEKYGSLRLYSNAAPQEVMDVLHKYDFISQYVCWYCGSPEATVVNDYGWYLPVCKCCWDKNNKRREAEGYSVIRPWEEVAELEDVGLPSEYHVEHMSKDGCKHETVDISETTNKIWDVYRKRMKKRG